MTSKLLTVGLFTSLLTLVAIDRSAHADRGRYGRVDGQVRGATSIASSLIEAWGRPQPGRVLAGPGVVDVTDPLATGMLVSRGVGFGSDISGDLEIQNLGDTDLELYFNSGTTIARVPAGAHMHLTQVKMWHPEWIEYKGLGNGSNLQFVWAWSYVRP